LAAVPKDSEATRLPVFRETVDTFFDHYRCESCQPDLRQDEFQESVTTMYHDGGITS